MRRKGKAAWSLSEWAGLDGWAGLGGWVGGWGLVTVKD